ncbi:hypothetical protein PZB75_08810 [Streptomyces sp. AM 4-1-1]|uniref:hypothetical protein n=1 Tax=unclassified Streptomyces TaxID=2593676 RepID=UPI0023B903E6|nr:hypothetical protein [Streptomyces sp. AM 4-1-1]WEH33470.1 hypothetical protein PZB75_08810 [Streptomyces sp. AM 4-1-1]
MAGPEASGGRGLVLVDALADRWGFGERAGVGKVVRAELSASATGPVDGSGECGD